MAVVYDQLYVPVTSISLGTTDPTNWWMTEKLDGLHFFWNGKDKLCTKLDTPIAVPAEISSKLPSVAFEGHLW
jgi:hypothetical protein